MIKSLDKTSDEFGTPQWLFDLLDDEFSFTFDAAASEANHKCAQYFTKEIDALKHPIGAQRVFCNPPYSNGMKEAFARKAYEETEKDCPIWVMILPTCTDQPWFHELVKPPRVLRYDIRGRVKFEGGKDSARDSHMILVFRNKKFCEFERPTTKRRKNAK